MITFNGLVYMFNGVLNIYELFNATIVFLRKYLLVITTFSMCYSMFLYIQFFVRNNLSAHICIATIIPIKY